MGKYYYVPSTYKGKRFRRKRRRGGAYKGCGRICGGSLMKLSPQVVNVPTVDPSTPVDIPVAPAQVEQNLLAFPEITDEMIERARKIIALAEATGKAQPITQKEAGIWSGLKNLGSKVWSGVKTVASNPLVRATLNSAVPLAVGAMIPGAVPYVQKGLDFVGKSVYNQLNDRYKGQAIANASATENLSDAAANLGNAAVKGLTNGAKGVWNGISNWWRGSGKGGAYRAGAYRAGAYRGCGKRRRLKKGSPEAKAYMAMLRSMRGKKKSTKKGGARYTALMPKYLSGGMFRGVTYNDLARYLTNAVETENKGDNDKVKINWKDENGQNKQTMVKVSAIKNMLSATDKLRAFYSNRDKSAYLKDNYGKKSWRYQMMGSKREARLKRQLNSLNKNFSEAKLKRALNYWNKRAEPYLYEYIAKKLIATRNGGLPPPIVPIKKHKKKKKTKNPKGYSILNPLGNAGKAKLFGKKLRKKQAKLIAANLFK